MKQLRRIIFIIIVGAVLIFTRTDYLLVRPGSAEDLAQLVTVQSQGEANTGAFYLVTVAQQKASPALLLYGLFDPIVDIEPSRNVIPSGMDPQEYQKIMERWMEESQNLARVIALRKFGYDVPIKSDGIEVVEVGEN